MYCLMAVSLNFVLFCGVSSLSNSFFGIFVVFVSILSNVFMMLGFCCIWVCMLISLNSLMVLGKFFISVLLKSVDRCWFVLSNFFFVLFRESSDLVIFLVVVCSFVINLVCSFLLILLNFFLSCCFLVFLLRVVA